MYLERKGLGDERTRVGTCRTKEGIDTGLTSEVTRVCLKAKKLPSLTQCMEKTVEFLRFGPRLVSGSRCVRLFNYLD